MMGARQSSPRSKAGAKWLSKVKKGQVAPKGLHLCSGSHVLRKCLCNVIVVLFFVFDSQLSSIYVIIFTLIMSRLLPDDHSPYKFHIKQVVEHKKHTHTNTQETDTRHGSTRRARQR